MKKKRILLGTAIFLFALLLGCLIYIACGGYSIFYSSYLQSERSIYDMECGIIYNNRTFRQGEDYALEYDFDHSSYAALLDGYDIEEIAGDGNEFQKALRLMDEFSPRLTHKSDYDNHIEMNSLALLEYALDDPRHGINCRAKAQILNEMYLAQGIYSRKVWIHPYSRYDGDCHVVNEIWSPEHGKWIMLDITNNLYFVDDSKTPLSILELRDCYANQKFCTPVEPGDTLDDLQRSLNKNVGSQLYFAKNMVAIMYLNSYTVGEDDTFYWLYPENLAADDGISYISIDAVKKAPY